MNDRNYIAIPGWMRTELDLKGNELLIYAIIYGICQIEDHKYTASLKYLEDWCGISQRTAITVLKELTDKGLLTKEERNRNGVKFCEYTVNFRGSEKISDNNLLYSYISNTYSNPNNTNTTNTTKTDDNIILARFDKFWTVYPNKTGKGDARKAWKKIRPSEELTEKMIKAVQRQQHEDSRWLDGYIPNPSTWLNQERWEDKPFTQGKGKGPSKILSERDYDSKDFDEWTKVDLKSW